jgi:outer membrane protein TolC
VPQPVRGRAPWRVGLWAGILWVWPWLGWAHPAALGDAPSADDLVQPSDLQAVAGELIEGPMQPSLPLSLGDAVALGVRQNRFIRLAALQRIAERYAVFMANDKFKVHYSINGGAGPTWSSGPPTVQSTPGFNVGLAPHVEWLAPSGTLLSADLSANRWLPNSTSFSQTYSTALLLGLRQPLLKDFGVEISRASIDQAVSLDGIRRLTYSRILLDQVSAIVYAYRNYTQASLLHSIAQKAVNRALLVLTNNQQMVNAGRLARGDLVQVQADIANRKASLAAAEASRTATQIALLQLLALQPTTPVVPVPEPSPQPVGLSLEQARSTALCQRPEYVQAVLAEQVAVRALLLARNARRWDLALSAQYQRGGANNSAWPALGDLGRGPSQGGFVGLSLSMPVFDVIQDMPVVGAQVELAQSRVARQTTAIALALEADGALRNLHLQQRVYRLAVQARRLSAKNLENEQEKLQAGRSSTFVVLRFVDDLVNAERAEIYAQVGLQNAGTAVETQLGTLLARYAISTE